MTYYTIKDNMIWTLVNELNCYITKLPMHNIIKNKTVILPPFYGISNGKLVYYKLVGNTINNNKEVHEIFIRYLTKEDYDNLNNGLPIFILDHRYNLSFNCVRDNITSKIIDDEVNKHKYEHYLKCLVIEM